MEFDDPGEGCVWAAGYFVFLAVLSLLLGLGFNDWRVGVGTFASCAVVPVGVGLFGTWLDRRLSR